MKFLFTTILFTVFSLCFSQDVNFKYGNVDAKSLQMKSYDKDPEAGALILYEKGVSEIIFDSYRGFYIQYTYTARYKIFDKKSFNKATFEIPLYKSEKGGHRERIVSIKAKSYNADGESISVSKSDIFKEDYSSSIELAKFTIPKVKEGTVFDVEYTKTSPYDRHFPSWNFQSDIPKLYSEYETKIPGNYTYNAKIVGTIPLASHTSKLERDCVIYGGTHAGCGINNYVMKDIPAFKEEKYMTSSKNYKACIDYELSEYENFRGVKQTFTKTWKAVDKEVKTEDLGKQARKEKAFEKLIPVDIALMPEGVEKAKSIYYFLQNRMVWDETYKLYNNIDVKKAYENKTGSRSEMNLVLLNMLKASGFDVYMVLIREREDGLPTLLYPVMLDFNYVVVKLVLDDKVYYLDITESYLPFGLLPIRAINDYGRVFDFKNESKWDNIYMTSLSKSNIFVQYEIDSVGAIISKSSNKYSGFHAVSKRQKINSLRREVYLESLENDLSDDNNAFISNYENYNASDAEKVLIENYHVTYEDLMEEDRVFLSPLKSMLFNENPFKLKERTYPVDFGYPLGYSINMLIKLSDNYDITNIPESFTYEYKNLIKLNFKVISQGNNISFKTDFYVYKSVFLPEEYDELKKAFSKLVDITNLTLILNKKAL
ncbi:hypothetical protein NBRC110019_02630 [Neptunitalea chrysea]|uniref:DUF3857 domain-containing protein n=1 Tax=Neptunitalea chrysea TaxID=1647581 RepID=A0A9W6B4P6_9FLAO|nr:hypothetical protein [Neptunitalea chrysea]GLB51224.1 hypothetical protein NBRC110019_02630 [Neptunitalea chrysea]